MRLNKSASWRPRGQQERERVICRAASGGVMCPAQMDAPCPVLQVMPSVLWLSRQKEHTEDSLCSEELAGVFERHSWSLIPATSQTERILSRLIR